MDKKLADDLDYYAGSRDMQGEVYNFLKSNEKQLEGLFYRGMPFPEHLIKKGTKIEEWHGSCHWCANKNTALNFAIPRLNGYINEDYYEELVAERGEANVNFVPMVMVIKKFKAIELYKLLKEAKSTFAKEKEITTVDYDYKIESVETKKAKGEMVYFVNVRQVRSR